MQQKDDIDSLQVPENTVVDSYHVDIRLQDVISCSAISSHTVHDSRLIGSKVNEHELQYCILLLT